VAFLIGDDRRGRGEVCLGAAFDHVAIRRAAIDDADIDAGRVGVVGLKEIGSDVEDRVRYGCRQEFGVGIHDAHPELVVVADDLIPRDRGIEPGGLKRFLIADGVGAAVIAGAGLDVLAVHHVDEPAQFVELGTVGHIPEHDAEVEGRLRMQGVDGPDGGVEDLGRGKHDRRVGLRIEAGGRGAEVGGPSEIGHLRGRLLVGDVDIAEGEKREELRGVGRAGVAGGHEVELAALIFAGGQLPGAVAELAVEGNIARVGHWRT